MRGFEEKVVVDVYEDDNILNAEAVALPTFEGASPDVSPVSSTFGVKLLCLANCLVVGLLIAAVVVFTVTEGSPVTVALIIPLLASFLLYAALALSLQQWDEGDVITNEDFVQLLLEYQKERPVLLTTVKCYHRETEWYKDMDGNQRTRSVDKTTFRASKVQEFADFVDVSPNLNLLEDSKQKRFLRIQVKSGWEPIDEAMARKIEEQKKELRNLHQHRDEKIHVSMSYAASNFTKKAYFLDRRPEKKDSSLTASNLSCLALVCCWAFPLRLWKNQQYETITYNSKKLLSDAALDEGYKQYIDQERSQFELGI